MNQSKSTHVDVLIIGGGIAGAGAAYEIAAFASVIVLEGESQCGYHSTGRSAASFTENYGNAIVRRLAIGSRSFLSDPPAGFCDHPILMPRGMITVARGDQLGMLERELERARALVPAIRAMTPSEAITRVPILRADYVAGAFFEPDSMEVDVHGLHHGFLKAARQRGAQVVTDARVSSIERMNGQWSVKTGAGDFCAPVIVNAAGAWGDEIAAMAGVAPLGLMPKRRTAFNIPVPKDIDMSGWPLINDAGDEFYFKPDAGQLFVSPSDATPSVAMDAYPDDMDVAVGVERLEQATTLTVHRVSHSWAGLRTFAPDSSPVVGPDATAEGFFWLVGQGGYGIKTSPALSRICAALVRQEGLPEDLLQLGITEADLLPVRLR
ncbi:FAD-dependent oxidoreductase [Paraburkholderia caffeinilytica]|uniref:FAD-dependent catabolic D-arginine dehydrogenase DauA n=1 Tax=Paraburkholderia caffeinilytica TaxID=1761016 RepID=A0ABQ1LNJ0_9BURK|nr:FAD-binding oxidoreductase [Paraburkholderia caffeinilytica]AXL53655.1 FAD-dependent oxidoreductase [Paraburkholderia caffeinilytica]GGC27312.1 FAD-dependent catabolic D-arginine dehydrogenase DauA [Paraburkholderia caffeinilytica]CAB3780205.1 FAD-dependent catabolic D-arginine dehydrogenase DauA [Paraburkholderia caffeinilytica]